MSETTVSLFKTATNTERHEAGGLIFSEGDVGETFYIVREGSVILSSGGRTLEEVGRGGIFGELALVDHAPRSATATAGTDCELVPVDERYFQFLVGQTPFFAQTVMRAMAARLRRASAGG